VLGRVIEVVSGKSYAQYVNERIYTRAGMTASGFFRSGDRMNNIAVPVVSDGTGRAGRPGMGAPQAGPRPGNPAGGGYSTAADLFRFARALRSGRLLGPKMTQYALNGTFAEDPKWGFSLREQMAGTRRFIGNGGGAPGVNAEFRFEPAGPYTVVVLSNSSPPSATDLLGAILDRIAGVAPGTAAQPSLAPPVRIPPTVLRAEVEALHAQMMGAFRTDPAGVARFYTETHGFWVAGGVTLARIRSARTSLKFPPGRTGHSRSSTSAGIRVSRGCWVDRHSDERALQA
jgi:hypothetical protein